MLFLFKCLFFFYISILIFRSVMTNQELLFNPFGKFIARITRPIFDNLLKNFNKEQTNRLIPVIILFVIFFIGIVYWLFTGGSLVLNILQAYIDSGLFLYFFYIFSLIIGIFNGTTNISFISTFFHRAGLPLVNLSRKLVKIQNNNIVFIAILLLTLIYLIIEVMLIGTQKFFAGEFFLIYPALIQSIAYILLSLLFILRLYTWLIIIRVLLSWVAPDPYNMVVQIIYALTEPIMAPFRRIIPPLGFIDISPIILIFVIEFIRILLNRMIFFILY